MNLTEEQVIELFEQFLDENYYVGELTEANVLWIYEEEFLPTLEQSDEQYVEEVQEEQQISPKMQAYLNEMSKKGTRYPVDNSRQQATKQHRREVEHEQASEDVKLLSRYAADSYKSAMGDSANREKHLSRVNEYHAEIGRVMAGLEPNAAKRIHERMRQENTSAYKHYLIAMKKKDSGKKK